jgi:hypothetical protein
MMAGVYQSDDIEFSAAMLYLYGEEALLAIDTSSARAVLTLDVPSEDAKIYREQFDADELSISSLRAYCKVYSALMNRVRKTRTSLGQQWCSSGWIAGKGIKA